MEIETQVLEILKTAIKSVLGEDVSVLPQSRIRQDLHLSSLDTLEVLVALEKKLGVSIDLLEFFELRAQAGMWGTSEIVVKDLIRFIATKSV